MSEQFQEQPDGRLVSGPGLPPDPQESRGASKFLAIAILVLATFSVGLVTGYLSAPEPEVEQPPQLSLGEQMFAEIKQGCIPFPVSDPQVGLTEEVVNSELHRQAEQFPDNRSERYIAPIPPGPVREAFPDLKFIGTVIIFNCLGDS